MAQTSWRRTTAVALVVGLIAAACGGSESSESPAGGLTTDPVTLTIQIFNAGGQAELEYRQAQAADFTALHPNVTVEIVQSGNYIDTVLPQIAAGTVGDVIWTDTDTGFTQFAVAGAELVAGVGVEGPAGDGLRRNDADDLQSALGRAGRGGRRLQTAGTARQLMNKNSLLLNKTRPSAGSPYCSA